MKFNKIKQTKLESLIESAVNTGSGLALAMILTAFFQHYKTPFLYLGDGLTNKEIIVWTFLMTGVSILRSYVWRRFFANELHKKVKELMRK